MAFIGGSRKFRWESANPFGGANPRHSRFLAKMYAKMKELGPVGWGTGSARSTNGILLDRGGANIGTFMERFFSAILKVMFYTKHIPKIN